MKWWRARVTEWLMNKVRHLGSQRARYFWARGENCEDEAINIGLHYIAASCGTVSVMYPYVFAKLMGCVVNWCLPVFRLLFINFNLLSTIIYLKSSKLCSVAVTSLQRCHLCRFRCISSHKNLTLYVIYNRLQLSFSSITHSVGRSVRPSVGWSVPSSPQLSSTLLSSPIRPVMLFLM